MHYIYRFMFGHGHVLQFQSRIVTWNMFTVPSCSVRQTSLHELGKILYLVFDVGGFTCLNTMKYVCTILYSMIYIQYIIYAYNHIIYIYILVTPSAPAWARSVAFLESNLCAAATHGIQTEALGFSKKGWPCTGTWSKTLKSACALAAVMLMSASCLI